MQLEIDRLLTFTINAIPFVLRTSTKPLRVLLLPSDRKKEGDYTRREVVISCQPICCNASPIVDKAVIIGSGSVKTPF